MPITVQDARNLVPSAQVTLTKNQYLSAMEQGIIDAATGGFYEFEQDVPSYIAIGVRDAWVGQGFAVTVAPQSIGGFRTLTINWE